MDVGLRGALAAAVVTGMAMATWPSGGSASPPTDNWAMFHHDPLHTGVSSDTVMGGTEASSLGVQWSQTVGGGMVIASPAVVYNATLGKTLVYAVSLGGVVHAFDTAGNSVWTSPQNIGSGAVDSPAIDGNSLYIGSDNGVLTALDATTGALQCTYQLPIFAPETAPGRIEASPVVGHDSTGPIVYFGDTGQSESVNHGHEWAINGVDNTAGGCTLKWVHDLASPGAKRIGSWSPPALGTDSTGRPLLVFGTSQPDDAVYALDARDGSQVWRFQTLKNFSDADVGAGPTISAPGVNGFGHGVVYVDGKDRIEYAIDMLTGAQLWQFDLQADSGHSSNSVSSAALTGNLVVVAYWKYVYAFNAMTGAKVWRTVASAGSTLGSVSVSGAAGDQEVLRADLAGGEYAYRLSDGALLKTVKIASTRFDASNAVADGMAFIDGEDGNLYGLSEAASTTTGWISGTVTDSGTSAAIGGATVSCPACPTTTATTDQNGLYTFSGVPPGGYSLSFSATGYTSVNNVSVSVTAATTTTQDEALTPTSGHQPIFSDGFETGFTPWTSSTGLSTESTNVHSGSLAAHGSVSSAAGDARETLPSTYTSAYARVWLNLASHSTQVYVLQDNTTTNTGIATVYVNSAGFVGIQAADGSRYNSTVALSLNTWHELELRVTVNGTASAADLWFDNMATPLLSLTNINLKSAPVAVVQVGDQSTHTWDAAFDDAAFDTQFIP